MTRRCTNIHRLEQPFLSTIKCCDCRFCCKLCVCVSDFVKIKGHTFFLHQGIIHWNPSNYYLSIDISIASLSLVHVFKCTNLFIVIQPCYLSCLYKRITRIVAYAHISQLDDTDRRTFLYGLSTNWFSIIRKRVRVH